MSIDLFVAEAITTTFANTQSISIYELALDCITQSLAIDVSKAINSHFQVNSLVKEYGEEISFFKQKFSINISSEDLQSIILKLNLIRKKVILGEMIFHIRESYVTDLVKIYFGMAIYSQYENEILKDQIRALASQVEKMNVENSANSIYLATTIQKQNEVIKRQNLEIESLKQEIATKDQILNQSIKQITKTHKDIKAFMLATLVQEYIFGDGVPFENVSD